MARRKKDPLEKYTAPFPSAMRELMREKRITQETLSNSIGKTRQTISQYVNGESEPSYETLVQIANHFDVSVDFLLGRTKERRRVPSQLDDTGLSSKSVEMLRLAYEVQVDGSKVDDLATYLFGPNWNSSSSDTCSLSPEEKEKHNDLYRYRAWFLSRALPDFVNDIITLFNTQGYDEDIVRFYSELAYLECRPQGVEEILPGYEYSEIKAYQISKIIKKYLFDRYKYFTVRFE